jgi:fibronectin-binding autotransporter adhesin
LAASIQATGLASFGDFAVGELCALSSLFSYTGSPYCSNGGTATPTITGTAGTFTSTAGLSINSVTGAVNLAASTAGTYIVTNSATSAGGCASSSTASITITAAPSATISYAGNPYCSSSGIATVARTGTAAGTYSSTAGLIINATTGDITLGTSTSGTYTVTYTIAATGGCSIYTTTNRMQPGIMRVIHIAQTEELHIQQDHRQGRRVLFPLQRVFH